MLAAHMSYAELISHLYAESGLQIREYAERIGYSTVQVSLVLNGHQSGSLKMLEACIRQSGRDIQEFLTMPEGADTQDEKRLVRALRRLSDDRRSLALRLVEQIVQAQSAADKEKNKRSSHSPS